MTDDQIMAHVWTAPDLPVQLTGPNAEYPWGPPIPWPRERVEMPRDAGEVWYYRCDYHHPPLTVITEPSAPYWRQPVIELQCRRWGVTSGSGRWTVRVYLGQCEDCGRIYWGIVRQ